MKKLKFLTVLFCLTSLFLSSCSKDNDGGSGSIKGKWEYFKEGYEEKNIEILTDYQNDCSDKKDFIEFLSGSVVKTHIFRNPMQASACQEAITTGRWSRNGDMLQLTFESGSQISYIIEESNQFFKVRFFDDEDQRYNLYVFKRI